MTNTRPIEYDHTRLVVWPEWGSSGIWHPESGSEIGAESKPVIMVTPGKIGLPDELTKRLDAWIEWYDDLAPESPALFPWDAFNQEGLRLAHEIAQFVGAAYQVEFGNQLILPDQENTP